MSAGSDYALRIATRLHCNLVAALPSSGSATLPVARLRAHLFEDRLEQDERREDVLARERPRTPGTPRHQGLLDRAMLLGVFHIEAVERVVTRRPYRRPPERA